MRSIYAFLLLIFAVSTAGATHFKGGDIIVTRTSASTLTYKIKVRTFTDTSPVGQQAGTASSSLVVCFGDGQTATFQRLSATPIPGMMAVVNEYEGTYTYSSGGIYQISAAVDNRTSNLLNLPNSEMVSAQLWTVVSTSAANQTPALPTLAFTAGANQLFSADLKPLVADSDSTVIKVARLSKASPGTCGVRMTDHNYIYPNDITRKGTFRVEGQKLVWNAPERIGNYTFALVAEEWRDGMKISESYHEGTIDVQDKPGPTVESPEYVSAENAGVITSIPKVESSEVSMAIEAYPVPTQDFVTVKAYSKTKAVIRLQLIDLKGRVIKQLSSKTAVISMQEEIDMRQLASGVYVIRADNATDSVSQKVVR